MDALARFVGDVRAGVFPSSEESYHATAEVVAAVLARTAPPDPAMTETAPQAAKGTRR